MKKPVSIEKADIKAFLGPGSKFEGKLSFDEMVRLDGSFVGEINSSDTLVVGDTAVIEGEINVGALILSGQFSGNVKATTMVELRAPAKVEGTIETPQLKIEEKVIFNGQVKMTSGPLDLKAKKSEK
ncbi:protein CcmA, bactofilin family [Malonomonas rubra DSM 5091]|uniref:Protein CcmA, bactofilin family n=2 Tax=Malonomonas rubra TaxID=57040 RepID=A0A1M6JV60_MALRU|nr:protein CcmA, bactofilin family [Malonomonas rubra DSM 5091]